MPYKDPQKAKEYRQRKYAELKANPEKHQARLLRNRSYESSHKWREAHKEELSSYNRNYHEANREAILERKRNDHESNRENDNTRRRIHYRANKQAAADYQRAYVASHKEERAALWRKYKEAKREAIAEGQRKYRREHPEKNRIKRINRRAIRYGAVGSHTQDEWQDLCSYYMDQCLSCGNVPDLLTRDHVIPLSEGGSNYISNIQPLCLSCNSRKGTGTIDFRE